MADWAQKGSKFDGEEANSFMGEQLSVAILKRDIINDMVAIGIPGNDSTVVGKVEVYQWNSIENDWVQFGSTLTPIDGTHYDSANTGQEYQRFGHSVAIDGSSAEPVLVISAPYYDTFTGGTLDVANKGRVYIYRYDSTITNDWVLEPNGGIVDHDFGEDGYTNTILGWSVAIATNRIAVSARDSNIADNDDGVVYILLYDTGTDTWALEPDSIGGTFFGNSNQDRLGHKVSLADDGLIRAFSAIQNGTGNGYVQVYDENTQLGADIIGQLDNNDASFGWDMNLNKDGNIIVISTIGQISPPEAYGFVQVFEYRTVTVSEWDSETTVIATDSGTAVNSNGTSTGRTETYDATKSYWIQKGNNIRDTNNTTGQVDEFGFSTTINADGNVISIGGRTVENSSVISGAVFTYVYNESTEDWDIKGSIQYGDNVNDNFGSAISSNYDGDIIGVGARFDDDGGASSGSVTLFEYSGVICFLAGSKVTTDQGIINIENVTRNHTINGNKINLRSKIRNRDDHIILIKPHAFGKNRPNRDTYITRLHGIYVNSNDEETTKIYKLVDGKKVIKVYRTGDTVYSIILQDKQSYMYVNGLKVETTPGKWENPYGLGILDK